MRFIRQFLFILLKCTLQFSLTHIWFYHITMYNVVCKAFFSLPESPSSFLSTVEWYLMHLMSSYYYVNPHNVGNGERWSWFALKVRVSCEDREVLRKFTKFIQKLLSRSVKDFAESIRVPSPWEKIKIPHLKQQSWHSVKFMTLSSHKFFLCLFQNYLPMITNAIKVNKRCKLLPSRPEY